MPSLPVTPVAEVDRKDPESDPSLVDVGAVEDFPVGSFRIVAVSDALEVGVLRRPDGHWRAARNSCPHRLAPICKGQVTGTMVPGADAGRAYDHDGSIVRCPWHGYEFDLDTGRALFDTFAGRLRTFEVAEHAGRVYVRRGRRS